MLLPAIRRFLRRRRFPTLMIIGALLFAINLVLPDPVPFIDEILLLIGTLVVGSLREKRTPGGEYKNDKETNDGQRPN